MADFQFLIMFCLVGGNEFEHETKAFFNQTRKVGEIGEKITDFIIKEKNYNENFSELKTRLVKTRYKTTIISYVLKRERTHIMCWSV